MAKGNEARFLTIAGYGKGDTSGAVEHIRLPAFSDNFTRLLQEGLNELDAFIEDNAQIQSDDNTVWTQSATLEQENLVTKVRNKLSIYWRT